MTAIEYVQRVIYIHLTHEEQMQFEGLFQQAKAMEKEQIMDAYDSGEANQYRCEYIMNCKDCSPEEFYNETYNS